MRARSTCVLMALAAACGGAPSVEPSAPSGDQVVAIPAQPTAARDGGGDDAAAQEPLAQSAEGGALEVEASDGGAMSASHGSDGGVGILGALAAGADAGLGTVFGGRGIGIGSIGMGNLSGKPYPKVTIMTPSVRGGLPAKLVHRIFRMNLPRVRHCYEIGLRMKPKLAGQVLLEIVISGQGNIQSIKTKRSTLSDKSVAACIVAQLKPIPFPMTADRSDVTVLQPIVLRPPPPAPKKPTFGHGKVESRH